MRLRRPNTKPKTTAQPTKPWLKARTHRSSLAARAATMLIAAAVVLGPTAALAYGLTASDPAQPAAAGDTDVPRTAGEQAAVEAFAERYVIAWLGADQDHEATLTSYVDLPDAAILPTNGADATDPAVTSIDRVETGRWSVTVAVLVDDVRRYYQAPIAYTDGALIAEALPAQVAAPARAVAPELDYADDIPTTDPVGRTVTDFMNGLLAGRGDVNRYLTPGSVIHPVQPAPFATVDLVELTAVDAAAVDQTEGAAAPEDSERLQLLATVVGDQQLTAQYAMTLTARDGRWEITSLEPAPQASEANPS